MADESEPQPTSAMVRPIPVVYFNHSRGHATQWELSLDLGIHRGADEPADVAVQVVTTWEHAKSIRDLLDRMLMRYEADVGPIRTFEHLQEKAKAEEEGHSDDADRRTTDD